jgi:hypothetical protein
VLESHWCVVHPVAAGPAVASATPTAVHPSALHASAAGRLRTEHLGGLDHLVVRMASAPAL